MVGKREGIVIMTRIIPTDSNGHVITKWTCDHCDKEMYMTLLVAVKNNKNDGKVL